MVLKKIKKIKMKMMNLMIKVVNNKVLKHHLFKTIINKMILFIELLIKFLHHKYQKKFLLLLHFKHVFF